MTRNGLVTAYSAMYSGTIMNEKRDEINKLLDESGLSVLMKISLLDMMAYEMKYDALRG